MKPFLKFDATRLAVKTGRAKKRVRANSFKEDLMLFAKRSLTDASRNTPVRELSLIRANQTEEYNHRINYIPSFHTLENPALIVNEQGEHWIYSNSKWYNADWRLPDGVWAQYQELLAERERRMQTKKAPFIRNRAQSRYLYRQQWAQVAESIGVQIPQSAGVRNARSRHNPANEPPRGYGQLRGGKNTMSVAVYTPLLNIPSRYISFSARNIIVAAMNKYRPQFVKAVQRRQIKELRDSFK